MQNPHAEWRIEFARQLAKRLGSFKGIQAIVIAGSVARGYADEYSDIEIPIFWESLPDDATRHAVVDALNGRFLHAYDGPAHEDQLLVDGVQVDLWDVSIKHQEEILEAVLQEHRSDLGALNALDTLRSCIPCLDRRSLRIGNFAPGSIRMSWQGRSFRSISPPSVSENCFFWRSGTTRPLSTPGCLFSSRRHSWSS